MDKNLVVTLDSLSQFCSQLTSFIQGCSHAIVLRSHQIKTPVFEGRYELLAGLYARQSYVAYTKEEVKQILNRIESEGQFALGYFAYEAGVDVPEPELANPAILAWWMVPEYRLHIAQDSLELTITGPNPQSLYNQIRASKPIKDTIAPAQFKPLTSRECYLKTVKQIQQDIFNGLYYELNYCVKYEATQVHASPYAIWEAIAQQHGVPLSALVKNQHAYLISCSPERFLVKHGAQLFSQPIKGTAPRGGSPELDLEYKERLAQDPKERAENVMIVDLVRNDLCRVCTTGSVKVEELLKVYTYPLVHQMISTVSGTVLPQRPISSILDATFPMGSMTGAPKKMVISKIHEYENAMRGPYSGCIGYLEEGSQFDLNVVIRTLVLNTQTQTASYHVGSAVTLDSNPENEWEECNLKAAFWQKIFAE